MKKLSIYLGLLLWVLLSSCYQKTDWDWEESSSGVYTNNSKVEVIWQMPICTDDSPGGSGIHPLIYNDKVILKNRQGTNYHITINDKITGEVLSTSNDFDFESLRYKNSFITEDHLVVFDCKNTISYDLSDMSMSFNSAHPHQYGGVSLDQNIIYQAGSNPCDSLESTWIIKSPVNNEDWQKLFSIKNKDGFVSRIKPPVIWESESNSKLLIFQNREYNSSNNKERASVYVIDALNGRLAWKQEIDLKDKSSTLSSPLVVDGKVYFLGLKTLTCLDVYTGEIIWHKYYPDYSFYHNNMISIDNKIIVKGWAGEIYAFTKEWGTITWINSNVGHSIENMVYYNGLIFLADRKLVALRASSGRKAWEETSPNISNKLREARFQNSLTIDEETGYLYTNDGYYHMCIKIPKAIF